MKEATTTTIRRLPSVTEEDIRGLAAVLVDCVEGGASVSFMPPLTQERAEAFWRDVAAGVDKGERVLLVAEDDDGIAGTVQLFIGLPENQPHRGDVVKMLVHRRARRRGLGAALMEAVEDAARDCARTLLVLDTASADAERLYARMGWKQCGRIPRFALMPDGAYCDTVLFYREL